MNSYIIKIKKLISSFECVRDLCEISFWSTV